MARSKKKKANNGPSLDDELPLWEFIYENVCEKEIFEEVGEELFEKFLAENQVSYSKEDLDKFYNETMKPSLYKSDVSFDKMLELYKQLEIEISPHIEQLLEKRCDAVIRLDSDRCLVRYSFHNGRPKKSEKKQPCNQPEIVNRTPKKQDVSINKTPRAEKSGPSMSSSRTPQVESTSSNLIPADVVISDDFSALMWNHIANNASRLTGQLVLRPEFWNELIESRKMSIKSPYIVVRHFHDKLLNDMWKQKLDPTLKMRLLKDLRVIVSETQKNWLLANDRVDVELSADGYVESWKTVQKLGIWSPSAPRPNVNAAVPDVSDMVWSPPQRKPPRSSVARNPVVSPDNRSEHVRKRTNRRSPYTEREHIRVWQYVYEKMKYAETHGLPKISPKGNVLWEGYIRRFGSTKSAPNWSSHFRKDMCKKLYEMPLNGNEMMYLYERIGIEMKDNVHKILEKKFNVKITLVGNKVVSFKFRTDLVPPGDDSDGEKDAEEEREEEEVSTTSNDAEEGKERIVEDDNINLESEPLDETMPLDNAFVEIDESEERESRKRHIGVEEEAVIAKRRSIETVEQNVDKDVGEPVSESRDLFAYLEQEEPEPQIVNPINDSEPEPIPNESPAAKVNDYLDLKDIGDGTLKTSQLLSSIQKVMSASVQIDHSLMSEAIRRSFNKETTDNEPNEEATRNQISDALDSSAILKVSWRSADKDDLINDLMPRHGNVDEMVSEVLKAVDEDPEDQPDTTSSMDVNIDE